MTTKNRQCTLCKKAKAESEFYKRNDCYQYPRCRSCSRKENKKRYDLRKKRDYKLW